MSLDQNLSIGISLQEHLGVLLQNRHGISADRHLVKIKEYILQSPWKCYVLSRLGKDLLPNRIISRRRDGWRNTGNSLYCRKNWGSQLFFFLFELRRS